MNEISCKVIADMLPLYAEGLVSEETRQMIDEHLMHCETCRAALSAMRQPAPMPKDDGSMLKKLRHRVFVQKARLAVFAGLIVMLIAALYGSHMNAPISLSAEEAIVSVTPAADMEAYEILLSHKVANWDFSINPDGSIYCTAWTTKAHEKRGSRTMIQDLIPTAAIWNGSAAPKPVTDNAQPAKKAHEYFYYYSCANPDDGEDVLIYKTPGAPEPDFAGTITLPRLVLNYYFLIAAALAAGCAVLTAALYIFRRRKTAWRMLHITLAPACYAIASFFILNGRDDVYNTEYYLSAILLIAVLMCLAIRVVMQLFMKGE